MLRSQKAVLTLPMFLWLLTCAISVFIQPVSHGPAVWRHDLTNAPESKNGLLLLFGTRQKSSVCFFLMREMTRNRACHQKLYKHLASFAIMVCCVMYLLATM